MVCFFSICMCLLIVIEWWQDMGWDLKIFQIITCYNLVTIQQTLVYQSGYCFDLEVELNLWNKINQTAFGIQIIKKVKLYSKQQMDTLQINATATKFGQSTKLNKTLQPQTEYISYDAPPLDFSYKNIVNLQQLITTEPRQGQKYSPQKEEEKLQKQQNQQETTQEEQASKQHKKPEKIKLLPQNNINSIVSTLVNSSAMKNISTKAKEELQKKKKKSVNIKLICCTLMLGYNKIRELNNFAPVIKSVLNGWQMLQWVDLSHNYLMKLDYDFADFPNLKNLYLHCNYLSSFDELTKLSVLKELKNFTIHGNSIASVNNFRLLVISILPQLKKLDNVLISKKQRENAIFIRGQTKKFPEPKIFNEPPTQKKAQEQQERE